MWVGARLTGAPLFPADQIGRPLLAEVVGVAAAVLAAFPLAGADPLRATLPALAGVADRAARAAGGSGIARLTDARGIAATGARLRAAILASAKTAAIAAVAVLAIVLPAAAPVALLAVVLLIAPLHAVARALGSRCLIAFASQCAKQRQRRQQGHEATTAANAGE